MAGNGVADTVGTVAPVTAADADGETDANGVPLLAHPLTAAASPMAVTTRHAARNPREEADTSATHPIGGHH
jgi:hypothetical protein